MVTAESHLLKPVNTEDHLSAEEADISLRWRKSSFLKGDNMPMFCSHRQKQYSPWWVSHASQLWTHPIPESPPEGFNAAALAHEKAPQRGRVSPLFVPPQTLYLDNWLSAQGAHQLLLMWVTKPCCLPPLLGTGVFVMCEGVSKHLHTHTILKIKLHFLLFMYIF